MSCYLAVTPWLTATSRLTIEGANGKGVHRAMHHAQAAPPGVGMGAQTCQGETCEDPFPTCQEPVTCPPGNTCVPGETCAQDTCQPYPTCKGGDTCPGTNTCAPGETCPGVETCPQTQRCEGTPTCPLPTCPGTDTCRITCGGVICQHTIIIFGCGRPCEFFGLPPAQQDLVGGSHDLRRGSTGLWRGMLAVALQAFGLPA